MPELPEVQTTVNGLNSRVRGQTIIDVWTDYGSAFHIGKDSIKDPAFFKRFKKEVIGSKITGVTRRAKNILIHIEKRETDSTDKPAPAPAKKIILIHMKMTGHILYAQYQFDEIKTKKWIPKTGEPQAFSDPFNRFIHFVMTLSNGRHIALSDVRKFAKVTLVDEMHAETDTSQSLHLAHIGPEPLDAHFTFKIFKDSLERKPNGKIKTVLMDQSIIAGIGNIYSDEALWRAGLHPEESVRNIPDSLLRKLYIDVKKVLKKGIDFGGDSMSDYRNINGERGTFQEKHQAYRKTGKSCTLRVKNNKNQKTGVCPGIILRKVVGGRSAHFCSVHQKLLKK